MIVISTVLSDLFIVQPGLCIYLRIAALMLTMKQATSWFRSWEFVRRSSTCATPPLPLPGSWTTRRPRKISLPSTSQVSQNIAPDVRREAATHIARVFTAQTYTTDQA